MINKLAELAQKERVLLYYCISSDNSMTIYVFANKFEDFFMIQIDLPYGICQSIGMALAKLELLEKQGNKVEE